MSILRVILSCWLGLLPCWSIRTADGAGSGSCTFSMTAIDFGQINVLPGTAVTGNGVLSVQCSLVSMVVGTTLYACVAFPTPRQIAGAKTSVSYDLYGPSPSTASWSNTTPIQFPASLLLNGGTATTTISAAVLAGQTTAPAGAYTTSVTATVMFGLTGCTTGQVYTTTFMFPVRATVASTCNVSAQNIAFGSVSLLSNPVDADGQINAQCTTGTGFTIGLDGGLAAASDPSQRQMKAASGSGSITYGLYQNAARSLPWGVTTSVNTLAATGTAAIQAFPVYARIPAQATPRPGSYADTVVMTVTY